MHALKVLPLKAEEVGRRDYFVAHPTPRHDAKGVALRDDGESRYDGFGTASDLAENTAGVVAARELLRVAPEMVEEPWSVEALAGRFVEISGGSATGALTTVAGLIVRIQERGELAAWVGRGESIFFPPDFAASGIDLAALPVVRTENVTQMARAADTLLRSGGFSLVVLDLDGGGELPMAMQTRLVGLAKQHHAVLVCITRTLRRTAARGSLVSLRVETERTRTAPGCFTCTLRAVKDKRRAPGWTHREMCHGPDGVC